MALTGHHAPLLGPNLADNRRHGLNSADTTILDASSEKLAWIGNVIWPGGATKSIRKIMMRTGGSISINSASQVRVSLQNIRNSGGERSQPDGSVDQSVTLAGSAFSSNANILTGALDADRSMAWGDDPICVVVEYTTFNSGDTIRFPSWSRWNGDSTGGYLPTTTFYNGSSWDHGDTPYIPNIAFEASDGTIGCFLGCPMASAVTHDVTFTTAEVAQKFQVAEPCTFGGGRGFIGSAADGRDITVRLYDAANNVLSSNVLRGAWSIYGGSRQWDFAMPLYDLSPATDYWLAMHGTGSGASGTKWYARIDVPTSAYVGLWGLGSGACFSTRATPGSGSWTDDTDSLVALSPWFPKFSDGTGSSGGLGVPHNYRGLESVQVG